MPAVEAWFLGGPVDGRLTPIEVDESGLLPEEVVLPQTGVYVGASDGPASTRHFRYVRHDDDSDPPTFHYAGQVGQDV
ncbi:hypothetical protein [Micromonospora sp. URMC 103]|uniref:hypothetical protein n=1 Tax=Micromonospora sp. URMC 103 TaxID=3423406 RepID=UPI003F1DD859